MKRNLSKTDRIVRTFIAVLLMVLFAETEQSLTINWLLLAGAAIMLGTAALGYCPLYQLLGIATYPSKKPHEPIRRVHS